MGLTYIGVNTYEIFPPSLTSIPSVLPYVLPTYLHTVHLQAHPQIGTIQ